MPGLAEVAEEFEVIVPLEDVIERNDEQRLQKLSSSFLRYWPLF